MKKRWERAAFKSGLLPGGRAGSSIQEGGLVDHLHEVAHFFLRALLVYAVHELKQTSAASRSHNIRLAFFNRLNFPP
jgi:hypothetical protein